MIQVRAEFQTPGHSQHEIKDDCGIIHVGGVELRGSSESPGMFGGVSDVGGGEEGEVPVFGDVPVEGVEGVDEDGEEPTG